MVKWPVAFEQLGTDIGGGRDLDPAWRVVSGARALADAIVRRLTTDAGALLDYPSYGFNVEQLIGTTLTASQIEQRITAQVFEEEEVEDAVIDVEVDRATSTATINITVTAGDGPFLLTINVSEIGVDAIIPPSL